MMNIIKEIKEKCKMRVIRRGVFETMDMMVDKENYI